MRSCEVAIIWPEISNPETNSKSPWKEAGPQKESDLPTIHFQGRTVSFREGIKPCYIEKGTPSTVSTTAHAFLLTFRFWHVEIFVQRSPYDWSDPAQEATRLLWLHLRKLSWAIWGCTHRWVTVLFYICLELIWLFQLDDSKSLHGKWLFNQTSIKDWLFRVPGVYEILNQWDIQTWYPIISGQVFGFPSQLRNPFLRQCWLQGVTCIYLDIP